MLWLIGTANLRKVQFHQNLQVYNVIFFRHLYVDGLEDDMSVLDINELTSPDEIDIQRLVDIMGYTEYTVQFGVVTATS